MQVVVGQRGQGIFYCFRFSHAHGDIDRKPLRFTITSLE